MLKLSPLNKDPIRARIKMSTVENGSKVTVHYRGTFTDGEEFDNSYSRDQPITFTVGNGETISGFDSALVGMQAGETKSVTLSPENAYGDRNEDAVRNISVSQFPQDFKAVIGEMVEGQNAEGRKVKATICEVADEHITLDFNHPMAGKELNFEINLVEFE